MTVQWSASLETGIEEVDRQHRELFDRVNKLLSAFAQGRGREEIGRMLDFLGNYVVEHFAAEERIMLEHNYPGYPFHKAEHVRLTEELTHLKEKAALEGPSVGLQIRINRTLIQWLVNHVMTVDKGMADFIKRKNGK